LSLEKKPTTVVRPINKTFSQKFPASNISGNPDFDQKIKSDGVD